MPTPLELAEDFTVYLPPRSGFLRLERDDFVLTTGLSGASVVRIRLADDAVEDAVRDVRELVRGHDVEKIVWWCGSQATPADLPSRLEAFGLVPDEFAPVLGSLVLDHEPQGTLAHEVRVVETFDDYVTAMEIDMQGWGHDERDRERRRANYEKAWQSVQEQGAVHYLSYLRGKPVGQARAFFLDRAVLLLGGATLPEVRGQGVYVSLVHARWRDAVARGTPALVVQAGPLSRPILERLGFRTLGEIRLLVDRL